ncbi:hypothetical protein SERLA73DRAFT_185443, partial [Serpula lacrymans var. lacrymans S7.3]
MISFQEGCDVFAAADLLATFLTTCLVLDLDLVAFEAGVAIFSIGGGEAEVLEDIADLFALRLELLRETKRWKRCARGSRHMALYGPARQITCGRVWALLNVTRHTNLKLGRKFSTATLRALHGGSVV